MVLTGAAEVIASLQCGWTEKAFAVSTIMPMRKGLQQLGTTLTRACATACNTSGAVKLGVDLTVAAQLRSANLFAQCPVTYLNDIRALAVQWTA